MKKIKNIILYLAIIAFFHSCNSLSDAGKIMRNEKVKTTDEFLVKKRQPLSLPPDFEVLPEPNSLEKVENNEESDQIKKLFKNSKEKKNAKNSSSSIEQSIINKIGK